MTQVTVIWADEDDGMVPRLYHADFQGSPSDFQARLVLLYDAMEAGMDEETFALSADQMTTHILAILPGHVQPSYLWDGEVIGPRVQN